MKWPRPDKPPSSTATRVDKPPQLFRSLRTPLLLIMALAIVGTSWATYKVHLRALTDSLLKQAEQRAHASRDLIQNRLNKSLDQLLSHNRNLVARYDVRQALRRSLSSPAKTDRARLARLLESATHEFISTKTYLFDSQGDLRFLPDNSGSLNSEAFDIAAALKGQETNTFIREGLSWSLRSSVPLRDGEKVLGALVQTQNLQRHLASLADELKMHLALVDSSGAQTHSRLTAPPTTISTGQIEQVRNEGAMLTQADIQHGRLTHLMRLELGEHSFVLASQLALEPMLLLLAQKKREILQMTALMLVVILPLTAFMLHRLLRPLILLRKRANDLVTELVGAQPAEQQGHEISTLVAAFDDMAQALKEHEGARLKAEAELQQEHATLEVKVKERTGELEKTNTLLQREIAERTRARLKAEELQSLLASLIDSMPSALIGVDQEARITQWNLETQKMIGLSFEQVHSQTLYDVLPQLGKIRERIEQTQTKGLPNKVRQLTWPAGMLNRLVDIVVYPLSGPHRGGAVIRIDDITERSRIDELMMQTEKMMSVGGLAAGMAHEINNPLASIIQSVQVISQRLSPELEKNHRCADELGLDLKALNLYLQERQVRKMLGSILESGQRAGEIVSNMLSFTRRNETHKSEQDLAALLERAIDLATKDYDLKKKYDFHRIEIERNYATGLPAIICSPSQLQQVFFNLLQNAAQAMSDGSDPQNPPRISLALTRGEEMLQVDIADNGPGIAPEQQKRIFEPFFTTKEVGEGTGLGLSVSYFIITENHHGRIELDSTPGKGTRFRILLPIQTGADEKEKAS